MLDLQSIYPFTRFGIGKTLEGYGIAAQDYFTPGDVYEEKAGDYFRKWALAYHEVEATFQNYISTPGVLADDLTPEERVKRIQHLRAIMIDEICSSSKTVNSLDQVIHEERQKMTKIYADLLKSEGKEAAEAYADEVEANKGRLFKKVLLSVAMNSCIHIDDNEKEIQNVQSANESLGENKIPLTSIPIRLRNGNKKGDLRDREESAADYQIRKEIIKQRYRTGFLSHYKKIEHFLNPEQKDKLIALERNANDQVDFVNFKSLCNDLIALKNEYDNRQHKTSRSAKRNQAAITVLQQAALEISEKAIPEKEKLKLLVKQIEEELKRHFSNFVNTSLSQLFSSKLNPDAFAIAMNNHRSDYNLPRMLVTILKQTSEMDIPLGNLCDQIVKATNPDNTFMLSDKSAALHVSDHQLTV